MTLDESFAGWDESRRIFEALRARIEAMGPVKVRVTRIRVAFQQCRAFAWAWVPDRYLRGRHAPLVLTLSLQHRDPSGRWKEVVEPAPGRFTHHLELHSEGEVDDELCGWLREAHAEAGRPMAV